MIFMKEYQADTDTDYLFNVNIKPIPIPILFSIQNIKPILIPILKYQAITDCKNQGKSSFLNRISPETQQKHNIDYFVDAKYQTDTDYLILTDTDTGCTDSDYTDTDTD